MKFSFIPKELITKIKFNLDLSSYHIGGEASLVFEDYEFELFDFCSQWFNKLMSDYGFYKIDIGQYIGMFPLEVNKEKLKVFFNIDCIREGNWKDWFLEDKDTPLTYRFIELTKEEK